ncbi:hypothetical protein BpHYR1_034734 [Brachionus plicatilis]|uniref:Uncharacterized protein n=1 Tax=Brachionus plicatilis TaxID=10195 RepID=A0A3M7Q4I7_BRAPC|nr:hypothetical protein BpHYR1_034734 [Brachionus plicatilis]
MRRSLDYNFFLIVKHVDHFLEELKLAFPQEFKEKFECIFEILFQKFQNKALKYFFFILSRRNGSFNKKKLHKVSIFTFKMKDELHKMNCQCITKLHPPIKFIKPDSALTLSELFFKKKFISSHLKKIKNSYLLNIFSNKMILKGIIKKVMMFIKPF